MKIDELNDKLNICTYNVLYELLIIMIIFVGRIKIIEILS